MPRSTSQAESSKTKRRPTIARTAFVTGATGFVGSFLVDRLLLDGWTVIALARGSDAPARVFAALRNVRGRPLAARGWTARLRVVSGDVRKPNLGIPAGTADGIAREIDAVWHCAANFGGGGSGSTPFDVNVNGTSHVLTFAAGANQGRRVPFYYVSTAFASDCHEGPGREEPPAVGVAGRNAYESSKREAERLVLDWKKKHGFPIVIFRPSIILGHSRTGRAAGFAAYYDVVRSLCTIGRRLDAGRTGGALRIRSDPNLRINFVTIDFVIDAMCALAGAQPEGAAIFNLVNDEPALVGVAIAEVCRSFGLVGITLADAGAFVQRPMTKYERRFHAMIGFERPYLDRETLFDNSRFRRIIPAEVLPAPRITVALLRRINRSYRDHRTTPAAAPRAASRRPDAESSQLVVAE